MAVFEVERSLTDMINNGKMSDYVVVASDVPPRYLLFNLYGFFLPIFNGEDDYDDDYKGAGTRFACARPGARCYCGAPLIMLHIFYLFIFFSTW